MFQIHYCDYHVSERDQDLIYRPAGSGDYLFLHFSTVMKVYREEKMEIARPGACILYTPGIKQHYQAVRDFRNSYVHFVGPEKLGEHYGIPENQIFYPKEEQVTDSLLAQVHAEYLTRPFLYEERLDSLMRELFICLGRDGKEEGERNDGEGDLFLKFRRARYEILSECQRSWDTEKMAGLVNLSRSQFYVYYERFFHRSPKADLIEARLERAKNLLTNEALSVREVGQLCGFSGESHFNRYFKKHCGCSPGLYARRKRQKNGEES